MTDMALRNVHNRAEWLFFKQTKHKWFWRIKLSQFCIEEVSMQNLHVHRWNENYHKLGRHIWNNDSFLGLRLSSVVEKIWFVHVFLTNTYFRRTEMVSIFSVIRRDFEIIFICTCSDILESNRGTKNASYDDGESAGFFGLNTREPFMWINIIRKGTKLFCWWTWNMKQRSNMVICRIGCRSEPHFQNLDRSFIVNICNSHKIIKI